ncbi:MAG: hypothetical protein OEU32_03495 [Acidimicrobiia bacterium]|nr:hypothetical protein [Acidimicrobiia bacterium]
MDKSFSLVEADHITIESGSYLLGVRWNRPGFRELFDRVFAGKVREEPSPPNLSLLVGEESESGRGKHALYLDNHRILTTTSAARVMRASVKALEHRVAVADGVAIELNASALVRGEQIMVVDNWLGGTVRAHEPRLRTAGWRLWDTPRLLLDPATGTIGSAPTLDVDRSVLAELGPVDATEADELPTFDCADAGWVHPTVFGATRASQLIRLLRPATAGGCVGLAAKLDLVSAAVTRGRLVLFEPTEPVAVMKALTTLD